MNKVLKNSWALFLGMGFLMMAYGFQSSLLGVGLVQEESILPAPVFRCSGNLVDYFMVTQKFPVLIPGVGIIEFLPLLALLQFLVF